MYKLVKDDKGTQIKAVLTREDTGLAEDLSSATVVLKFRKKGTTAILFTLTSVADSDDAANGIAYFRFTGTNLDLDEGEYEGEIEATFSGGDVETVYEILRFHLRNDF